MALYSKPLDKTYLEKQFENYNKKLKEDVIDNLVPDKRMIAGLNLKQDIMISELSDAIATTLVKNAAFTDLFAKIVETGNTVQLDMDPNSYVITSKLKNKSGTVISSDSIDLPLESVVVNLDYNKIEGTIRLVLQNGLKTDPIRVSDITSGLVTETSFNQTVNNLVPNTRTIAGVDLKDNVTATELKTALGIGNVSDANVSNMVPNTRTIAGVDLVDNITSAELKTALALNNVNNTADANKNVASAAKLTTARNINGVSFDGTKDINLPIPEALTFIGGRNLVLGSSKSIGYMTTGQEDQLMSEWSITDYGKSKLSVGTKFVLSFDANVNVDSQQIGVNIRQNQSSAVNCSSITYFNLGNINNKRCYVYGEISAISPGMVWFLFPRASRSYFVTIENVKLELGEVATDFTEAPEELKNAIIANI